MTEPAGRLAGFVAEVGREGPVVALGGRTHWWVGGAPAGGARQVRAPAGILSHHPEELTVRCGAGTTVIELDAALAERGQMVPLDPADPARATVGGVLAAGLSGPRRLRHGPVRDALLEARYVSADGRLIRAGGPTVKNVSGYDLCRLLVGSVGTLGLLGEVVLRVRPRPAAARWLAGEADPVALRRRLHAPSSILWDGVTTWVLLEGHPRDVAEQAVASGLREVAGPPPLPPFRRSVPPRSLRQLDGPFVAEVGVGTVHVAQPPPPRVVSEPVRRLHERLKAAFDPTGRLGPGRDPLVR
ncbi:MAG: FAD-binding protein [Acidimicrobiales bacterium]|nr:FAD-binding protein [Acidimicrobiales bacterium]